MEKIPFLHEGKEKRGGCNPPPTKPKPNNPPKGQFPQKNTENYKEES